MRIFFLFWLMVAATGTRAQMSPFRIREAQKALVERLVAFGKTIPQEKVYIHMDNTCYFQGDTIWFAAYTRQTINDRPSQVSRVLYVELLNQEGYLVERKLIEMKQGRGEGFFALNNTIQYSGFYELRAYTRWQLNWGQYEREHDPFFNISAFERELVRRRYLDYEKLYSRVFPVYDHPRQAGSYVRDMTLRKLRRYYSKELEKRDMKLSFFPEGGNLIAGVPNRVAFEATMSDGEWLEGNLSNLTPTAPSPTSPQGEEPTIKTFSRGRGVFTIVPEAGQTYEMTFTTADGQSVKAKLPKAETVGAALQVAQKADSIVIETRFAGLIPDSLAMTIMHEGRVEDFKTFNGSAILSDAKNLEDPTGRFAHLRMTIPSSKLACGVNQVTVFDAKGRVYADRLFFVVKPDEMQPTLAVTTAKDQYSPYEPIELSIKGQAQDTPISLAVRDKAQQDLLYDNASIMTEMLLASEIRGFVPDPGWFFEQDDDEHREALDLLMMTQGWRRFNWRDMAVRGEWDLTEPDEQSIVLVGEVSEYDINYWSQMGSKKTSIRNTTPDFSANGNSAMLSANPNDPQTSMVDQARQRSTTEVMTEENAPKLEYEKEYDTKLKHKAGGIKVHAELVAPDGSDALVTEAEGSRFRIRMPRFYGKSILFIGAADTTKWKDGEKYTWVQSAYHEEDTPPGFINRIKYYVEPPKYIVRLRIPYPRFVNRYTFHQQHLAASTDKFISPHLLADGTTVMREVPIRARHGGLKQFDDSQPAMVVDAYEAYNRAIDDYLTNGDYEAIIQENDKRPAQQIRMMNLGSIVEGALFSYVGETGIRGSTADYTPIRYGAGPTRRSFKPELRDLPEDSIYLPKYLTSWVPVSAENKLAMQPGEMWDYDRLGKLDKLFFYSDYSPRLYGDKRYGGSNGPQDIVAIYPYPDGSQRPEYRDRRYVLDGFAYPAEFYSPDYSRQQPAEPTDYRRTLYWNPLLQLDQNGQARVTLYNNCRSTQISISAAGQTQNGTLLWNK